MNVAAATAGRPDARPMPDRFGMRDALIVALALAYPFHYYVEGLGGIVNVSAGDILVAATVAAFCANLLVGRWTAPCYLTQVAVFALVALVSLVPPWLQFSASPAFFDPVPGLAEIVKLFGSAAWMVAVYVLLRPDPRRGIQLFAASSVLVAAVFSVISIDIALQHPGVRQAGPFENENQYANYLALSVFLALILFRRGDSPESSASLLPRLVVPLLLVAILATGSRGGVLSFAAALPFAVDWRALARGVGRHTLGVVAAAGLCIGGLTAFWQANPLIAQRLTTVASGQGPNIQSREYLSQMGFDALFSSPIIGIGYHQFPQYAETLYGWKSQVVHDTYIETGAELGIAGMLAYGWLLVSVFRDAVRFSRDPEFGAARLIIAIMVATLVQGLFDDIEHDRSLWISFGMLAAIGYALEARRGGSTDPSLPVPAGRADALGFRP